ncbi:dirigent protein 23-like [Capsicum annuum]|nr:dirigent protein 23-like [Capsicum annuum]
MLSVREAMGIVVLIVAMTILIWVAEGQGQESWAKRVDTGKKVVTTLQFYFHDTPTGPNPSVVPIAQAAGTINTTTMFGVLNMLDDPLTVGPNPTSKIVGRARGLYGFASQTDLNLIMVMSFWFTDGSYKGSSLSLLSLNPTLNPVREMAIIGGTGLFRFGRGYALAHTYSLNPTTGDGIAGYNITIVTNV